MTRYFFDSSDGDFVDIDEDGIELSSDGEARLSALDALPDMARAVMPNGDCRLFTVSVRREDEGVIYRARMELTASWTTTEVGQPGRTSDSVPRPGTGIPTDDRATPAADGSVTSPAKGEPKPSTSPSALDPGRPVKNTHEHTLLAIEVHDNDAHHRHRR
ncbi:DUF6894 family protein [Bosea sp. 2RAB26]|uniref:DUF6894 family protein n=1 Tax=Bosea sp. 2RAB26 TaxID=3237476 RepID=UPI003F90419F